MLNLFFSKSFLKNFIKTPVGVTTVKKTIPITIGAIMAPNKIPNLNHNLFNGAKIFEFIKPKIKKIIEKKVVKLLSDESHREKTKKLL